MTKEERQLIDLLGIRVRQARKSRKWSQQRVADEARVSRATLANIERRAFVPSFANVTRIAGVLGLSIDAIVKASKLT